VSNSKQKKKEVRSHIHNLEIQNKEYVVNEEFDC